MPEKSQKPAQDLDQHVILPATPAPAAPFLGLIYLGNQAIVGIPARDLNEKDLVELEKTAGDLVATGLYRLRSESEI